MYRTGSSDEILTNAALCSGVTRAKLSWGKFSMTRRHLLPALLSSFENWPSSLRSTGEVFSKRIKINPQIHIQKFEEHTVWRRVPFWGSFLTSIGSSGLVRTLWMSEMTPSRAPVLKALVIQIFWCEFGGWFWSFLRKPDLYYRRIMVNRYS